MSEELPETAAASSTRDLDFEQARLAYNIISSLLEHTRVVSDLIALMAQTLDEDTTKVHGELKRKLKAWDRRHPCLPSVRKHAH